MIKVVDRMRRRGCLIWMDEDRTGPGIYTFFGPAEILLKTVVYAMTSQSTLVLGAFSCLPYLGWRCGVLVARRLGFSISNHHAGLFCQYY